LAAPGKRVIGIDLGERRIGVSVSDPHRVLASPHSVITRSSDAGADHRAIGALVSEFDAGLVVVGLPLLLSGRKGPAAEAAAAEALALEMEIDVPVLLHDERLTTIEADRRRRLSTDPLRTGRARGRTRGGAVKRAGHIGIDALAATVLLQSWLDQKRGES
jgi:putative Holliday junction resolvase